MSLAPWYTKHMRNSTSSGFALPTILIAAVVMMMVLVSSVTAVASIKSGLDSQYYNQLAREAAESGLERATTCLENSYYVSEWDGRNLYPNTTCSGGSPCTNSANCFVMQNGNVRTTFKVSPPVDQSSSQRITAEGKTELLRSSSGSVWRTYTVTANARVGIDLSLSTVTFGYSTAGGAFFGTIASDGEIRAVGNNTFGQLGNGTTSSTVTPTVFKLNTSERPVALYTNFLSIGWNMFAMTDQGKVYGAGRNDFGQLGNGNTTNQSTPVQFNLPAGKQAKFVGAMGKATFVLTTDGNLYAAGECTKGLLGSSYTISGCGHRSTYTRVALPTPTSDPNTQPTSKMALDAHTAYVIMEGGRVYGWGENHTGQLANGAFTDVSVPVKIGTYGDSGQPKAINIAYDGTAVYITDDSGKVKAAGWNSYGQLGNPTSSFHNPATNKCLDNYYSDGQNLVMYTCTGIANQLFTMRGDGSVYNANSNKCLDNNGQDGINVQLWSCNGGAAQKWEIRNGQLYNPNVNKCLVNRNGDGATVGLATCSTSATVRFNFVSQQLTDFLLPPSAGKAVKVTTDQWSASVLGETGEVWSAGLNNKGQLGFGVVSDTRFNPVRFKLPAGVSGVDINASSLGTTDGGAYNNLFVIGSNGRVYGAGANNTGQLGDGTITDRATPVAMNVINGSTIRAAQVQSGYGTTVILTTSKKIYTVGNNSDGQLGDGTTTNSSTPRANRYTNILPVTIF